jgi:hypothetical protein
MWNEQASGPTNFNFLTAIFVFPSGFYLSIHGLPSGNPKKDQEHTTRYKQHLHELHRLVVYSNVVCAPLKKPRFNSM